LDLAELLRIGADVRAVLASTASKADTLQWAGRYGVGAVDPGLWETLRPHLDPWQPRSGDEQAGHLPNLVASMLPEMVLDAVLGAVVYAVATAFPEPTGEARERAGAVDWGPAVRPHLDRALDVVAEQVLRTDERLRSLGDTLTTARRSGER
jgi:hypothetical protein